MRFIIDVCELLPKGNEKELGSNNSTETTYPYQPVSPFVINQGAQMGAVIRPFYLCSILRCTLGHVFTEVYTV